MQTSRSMTYLDTLAALNESRETGIPYTQFTKGELTHVKSLSAEGHVAWFTGDEVSYADKNAVAFLTVQGADYVSTLIEAGIVVEQPEPKAAPVKPKAKRRTQTPKPKASDDKVDSILDGVSTPKGSVKTKKVTRRTTKPKASINKKVSLELSSVEAEALRRLLSLAETQTLLAGPVAAL